MKSLLIFFTALLLCACGSKSETSQSANGEVSSSRANPINTENSDDSTPEADTATLPSITSFSSNQIITEGESVTLSVAVTGLELSYQWLLNGDTLHGETSRRITLDNVALTQAGDYVVIVSNSAGDIYSNTATLTVLEATVFGTARITWDAPRTREDGSTLYQDEILVYRIYFGPAIDSGFADSIEVIASTYNSATIDQLKAGDYRVAISTIDVYGAESDLSNPFIVAIN